MPDEPQIPPNEGAKARLLRVIKMLDDPTCVVLETIVTGLSARYEETIESDTDIVVPAFAKNLRIRLQLHHATHEEVFKKKTFEYAFKAACIAAGKRAVMNEDATSAGYDVIADGVRYSLKTEAGKKMSKQKIKISKLMEARWIRECRTGADFHARMPRILDHFSHYDRVLTLRVFRVSTPFEGVRYDLWEVPMALLRLISTLQPSDFSARREASGTSTAVVKTGGQVAFKLRLDGSVEKVTVEQLPVSRCRKHASWTVETFLSKSEDE